jgi:hypothetical protein
MIVLMTKDVRDLLHCERAPARDMHVTCRICWERIGDSRVRRWGFISDRSKRRLPVKRGQRATIKTDPLRDVTQSWSLHSYSPVKLHRTEPARCRLLSDWARRCKTPVTAHIVHTPPALPLAVYTKAWWCGESVGGSTWLVRLPGCHRRRAMMTGCGKKGKRCFACMQSSIWMGN